MTMGMRSVLRSELISEHRKAVSKHSASNTTKEYVEKIEKAYKKLGGNGLGESIYHEIMNLPTNEEEDI